MERRQEVARFSVVGLRIWMGIIGLIPGDFAMVKFALKGQQSWLGAFLFLALEVLLLIAARGRWLVFFEDRVEKQAGRFRVTIPYDEVTEVIGKNALKINGSSGQIRLLPDAFLRPNDWISAVKLIARFAPQARLDEAAVRQREGHTAFYRGTVIAFGIFTALFCLIVSFIAVRG